MIQFESWTGSCSRKTSNVPTPMATPPFRGLLLRVPASQVVGLTAAGLSPRVQLGGVPFDIEPLFTSSNDTFGITAGGASEWFLAKAPATLEGVNPWDLIHEALAPGQGFAAAGIGVDYAEPDFQQEWLHLDKSGATCQFDDQERKGGKIPAGSEFAWHLAPNYSGLKLARETAGDPGDGMRVRIAHLDTGYPQQHATLPMHLRLDLQKNFTDDGPGNDAHDPARQGLAKNPGHGTGTLGLLAGGRFTFQNGQYSYDGLLGGAPTPK